MCSRPDKRERGDPLVGARREMLPPGQVAVYT